MLKHKLNLCFSTIKGGEIMSLVINGHEILSSGLVYYNSVDLDKIICNGVIVWEKQKDITINPATPGGATISGSNWYGELFSQNEDLDGTTFCIDIYGIDLSPYSRVVLDATAVWLTSSADNGCSFDFYIKIGSKQSDIESVYTYHSYVDEEDKDDDYVEYEGKADAPVSVEMDISEIVGYSCVQIYVIFHHIANRFGEGKRDGIYRVNNIQFFQR